MTTPNRTPRQPPGRALRPLTVQIDEETRERLHWLAQSGGRSISYLARLAIEDYTRNVVRPADR